MNKDFNSDWSCILNCSKRNENYLQEKFITMHFDPYPVPLAKYNILISFPKYYASGICYSGRKLRHKCGCVIYLC